MANWTRILICFRLTGSGSTIWLLPASVHANIHMSHSSAFTIMSGIRVNHLHCLRIAAVQPIRSARFNQRLSRIKTCRVKLNYSNSTLSAKLTNNPLNTKVQIVCQQTTQMGTQRVTHACGFRHIHSGSTQKGQIERQAFGHRFQIVHSRHVAWRLTEGTPIDHECVVVAVVDVSLSLGFG